MPLVAKLRPIDDPAALEGRWRALERQASSSSFFLGWTWMGSWIAALQAAAIPLPDLLEVQDGEGADIALALVGRGRASRKLGRVPARWLNECGDRDGDRPYVEYNGLLCAPGREDEANRAFCKAMVAERGWSMLALSGVEQPDAFAGITGVRRVRLDDSAPACHVDLAAVRDAGGDYLSLLSANTRSQIRRSLKEEGAVLVVEPAREEVVLLDWLADMARLNAGRHEDNAWDNDFFRDFVRRIATTGLAEGSVELVRIDAGGEALGYLLNFRRGGRVMNYQSAFAPPRTARSKPGLMCHAVAIERAAAQGEMLYSFLAGTDRYKQSLSTGAEQLHWLVLERCDWRLEAEALVRRLLRR